MIEEHAIVVSSEGGVAQVETQRQTVCGGCSAKQGCGTAALAKVFGNRRTRLQVLNPVHAKAGDRVVIGVDEQALVKASLLVYLLPLVALILGAGLGDLGAQRLDLASSETVSVLGGLIGLSAGLAWVRIRCGPVQADSRLRPIILRTDPLIYPVRSEESSLMD